MNDSATAAIRVEHIVNPATGEPVKISPATTGAAALVADLESFLCGYQRRLIDEWHDKHAEPRQYSVRLRNGEPMDPFIATSHQDLGEWLVFFGSDSEPLMSIWKGDVVAFWREPFGGA